MISNRLWLAALIMTVAAVPNALACDTPVSVCTEAREGSLALIEESWPASIVSDASADPAVQHVVESFSADLKRVSGNAAPRTENIHQVQGRAVVIGVLGQSPTIDRLVNTGKLDPGNLSGQWEGYRQVVIENPWPNVSRALVIVGSDRRGAVYGTYDISEKIGVSPWYWFADVAVERQSDVYLTDGSRADHPDVRYRGFFINDEDPALSSWAEKKFGGFNADMYEHVFELLLRLKGNYLWPAMWYPKSFHLDDPKNKVLADSMGIVMGTSHHEPLTRAQSEWHRIDSESTGGEWNYRTNAENLRAFWRGGMERMMSKGDGEGYENLVTVGMRGDGDEPMSEGTAIDLLEAIVADQREIIEDVTGTPAEQTPQVWALYKEVQEYYDQGMTVPADVTLLFADDNWGQIRRLPTRDLDRDGGFGVYYHFDYVGVPRNYKWLNTSQIEKVWQQMDLAYERGARDIWVVNVGDIKPTEYPLDFFLEMAWDPEAMTPDALAEYPNQWAARQFGSNVSSEIAELVTTYSTYASRRKPSLINEDAFSIGEVSDSVLVGGEFYDLIQKWRTLVKEMKKTKERIAPDQKAAYFQLIEYPILALSNLYEMYFATAWNRQLASYHDPRANNFKNKVEATFKRDSVLTAKYHSIADGKWDGMMSQVHMNYKIWNDPTQQTMPSVTHVAPGGPMDEYYTEIVFASDSTQDTEETVIEASDFDRSVRGEGIEWMTIPHLGHSEAAVVPFPQGEPATTVVDSVRLEYDIRVETSGDQTVAVHLAPTLDTRDSGGIRLGVSIDGGPVQTLTSTLQPTAGAVNNPDQAAWSSAVINNGHTLEATFDQVSAGQHTLKIWRLDENVILEEIVIRPN